MQASSVRWADRLALSDDNLAGLVWAPLFVSLRLLPVGHPSSPTKTVGRLLVCTTPVEALRREATSGSPSKALRASSSLMAVPTTLRKRSYERLLVQWFKSTLRDTPHILTMG
eukprot:5071737-Amphidinium_carterae.2